MDSFTLSDDQIVMLHRIYGKRRNLLVGTMAALPTLIYSWQREIPGMILFNFVYAILLLTVLIILVYLFFNRLQPIKKDIREKSGVYMPHLIVRKSSFAYVGRYFFFFDDVNFPSTEVAEKDFFLFEEGDMYRVPMGKHSKLVVDGFMNYTLL